MKTRDTLRREAAARLAARQERSTKAQLSLIATRRGDSKREKARLLKA
jgi:hypothetical protein